MPQAMIKQAAQTTEQQQPKTGLLSQSSHNLSHPFGCYLSLKAWSNLANSRATMIMLALTGTQRKRVMRMMTNEPSKKRNPLLKIPSHLREQ
jgi:hypothetical protein